MRAQQKGGVGYDVTRSWWAFVLSGVVIVCAPLLAHHSFATYYIEADTIEVEGDIVEFQFKNPHSWVHVIGQEPFGTTRTYAAEWGGTSQLDRNGITKNTLRVGDSVRIWVSPNRNQSDNRVHLKRIERRSDGWKWGGQRGRENR